MQTIRIKGATGDSRIVVGERLANLRAYLPAGPTVIITDANVARLHGREFPAAHVIAIGSGEKVKNLDTVRAVYAELLAQRADRDVNIVGIGGGIVCDIAGFVAATYLRGVRCGFVASTLLAQVDASIGGKNGVNFDGYKNMVGTFNQPAFVLCDLEMLRTLPVSEVRCGLAEIVKHAAIADAAMFAGLEREAEAALGLDLGVVERLVHDSLVIKAAIVNRDEKEAGERRKLNFGHTFGHAVEAVAGIPHGEAVAIGMALAAVISQRRGLIAEEELQRFLRLLQRLGLPTWIQADQGAVLEALGKDKKRAGESIHFVLLEGIGRARVAEIPLGELREAVEALCLDGLAAPPGACGEEQIRSPKS